MRWKFYKFRPVGEPEAEPVKLLLSDDDLDAAIIDRDPEGNPVIEHDGQRLVMAYHPDWSHCAAAGWPMKCDAMGVHPAQIGEAKAAAMAAGVPTEFTRDGRVILTSRSHRRRYAHAMGYYDRNAGYGDPAPRNR